MKYGLYLLSLFLPLLAWAYVSPIVVPENPRTLLSLQAVDETHEYFGRLTGFPHTYRFEVTQEQSYSAQIFVPASPEYKTDVSVILVKEEKRGVTEKGRTFVKEASWAELRNARLSETFKDGGVLTGTLTPGTYILEVSSPNNDGVYRLLWGEGRLSSSYFAQVRALFAVKAFLGHTSLGVLFSPLIYLPLVLILSVIGFLYYRKRKQRLV